MNRSHRKIAGMTLWSLAAVILVSILCISGSRLDGTSHAQAPTAPFAGPYIKLSVHNMNIRSGVWPPESNNTLDKRIRGLINTFKSTLQAHQIGWDLIAINENEPIACYLANNAVISATECFALGIGVPNNQVFVHEELGLIVNTQKVDITGPHLVGRDLGWSGSAKRDVLAVPVSVKANRTSFLFATTHIITSDANNRWRREQVEDLVKVLRGWGQPTLLAGDFNCVLDTSNSNDRKLCEYVRNHFVEASGFNVIEHISLLKPHYIGRFENHKVLREFEKNRDSDHPVTYAEFVTGTGAQPPRTDIVGIIYPGEGLWGDWTSTVYCPANSYARGYEMRTEGPQGKGDDTALNAIRIDCANKFTVGAGSIRPHDGLWGEWRGTKACPPGQFMVAAKMQIEQPQGDGDDTSANQVIFQCSDGRELRAPAATNWGDFMEPFRACPPNSAICGVSVRFEASRGKGDDTALNGIRFVCCRY